VLASSEAAGSRERVTVVAGPARLDAKGVAEFITGEKWQTAPDPVVLEAWKNKS
jgi:hypothetical protein